MKDLTNEEFFDILNNVLMIGYGNVKYPKMATINSIICKLADVVDYNLGISDGYDVYKEYADRVQARREKAMDILEKRGYYDEDNEDMEYTLGLMGCDEYDYGYESNMFCDNTGYCCGSSCKNYIKCYGTSNK